MPEGPAMDEEVPPPPQPPEPAPVDIVDDAGAEVANAEVANAAGQAPDQGGGVVRRGRAAAFAVPWEMVLCEACGAEAGQYKFEVSPGLRDGPSWVMRTQDNLGAWPTSGPRFRTRRTSVVGDDASFAKKWCQTNRICCAYVAP